jgi:hypothetical protein
MLKLNLYLGLSGLLLGGMFVVGSAAQAMPTQATITIAENPAGKKANLGNSSSIGTLEVTPEAKSQLETPAKPTPGTTIQLPNSEEGFVEQALNNFMGVRGRSQSMDPTVGEIKINRGFGLIRTDL